VQTAASLTGAETLQNKSLLTPTIASFVNATHNHQDNAGGSTLAAVALADGFTGSGAFVRAASPTLSGQLTLPVGSAGSPALVFDSGNGLYSPGTDITAIATSGVERLRVAANGGLWSGSDGSETRDAQLTSSVWTSTRKGIYIAGDDADSGINVGTVTPAAANAQPSNLNFLSKNNAGKIARIAAIQSTMTVGTDGATVGGLILYTKPAGSDVAPSLTISPSVLTYAFGSAGFSVAVGTTAVDTRISANGVSGKMEVVGTAFVPFSDAFMSLGNASLRWTTVFATTGTINTSSREAKQDFRTFDPAEALRIVRETEFWRFRYKADQTYERVGFIAEDTDHTLSLDGKNSDPMTAAAVALAAVKGLSARVTALEAT
jgi:hypothetical protein